MPAEPATVGVLRRRAAGFVSAAGGSDDVTQAVALAVSETVTNAVLHAYDAEEGGQVRVSCHADGEGFIVPTGGLMHFQAPRTLLTGQTGATGALVSPDLTSDGRPDLLVRQAVS